jgi:hypothetical protein
MPNWVWAAVGIAAVLLILFLVGARLTLHPWGNPQKHRSPPVAMTGALCYASAL